MRVKVEDAISDMRKMLEELNKRTSALENKVNISLDAVEGKIKELEQFIGVIDDEYYELKKEMLSKLSTVAPYLDEMKKIDVWKSEVMDEVKTLEEGVRKMGKLMIKFNNDLKNIKKTLRMKEE